MRTKIKPGNPTAHRLDTYRCFLPDLAGFGMALLRGTWPSKASDKFKGKGINKKKKCGNLTVQSQI